jgi:Kef-type K+ transport system membrane component KefB
MGAIAKSLGLTDTAGAFAAGVLLANTNYRAQIQADILPFKGILLGVFFMDAGSSFDVDLALSQLPVVLAGALGLVTLKATTLGLATRVPRWLEPKRLPPADGLRLALLLSGGGEFAFVVLALAEKLKVRIPHPFPPAQSGRSPSQFQDLSCLTSLQGAHPTPLLTPLFASLRSHVCLCPRCASRSVHGPAAHPPSSRERP